MKGAVVIIDGAADEPCKELGGKTPLEKARTKNLDKIASKGEIFHSFVIKKGISPESSASVVSLFGYNPDKMPRGPLEALGLDAKIEKGDLVFRCNFGTIDNLESKNVIDRRVGRALSTEEAIILADAVNSKIGLLNGHEFRFIPGIQHRGVLIIKGNFNAKISNICLLYTSPSPRDS